MFVGTELKKLLSSMVVTFTYAVVGLSMAGFVVNQAARASVRTASIEDFTPLLPQSTHLITLAVSKPLTIKTIDVNDYRSFPDPKGDGSYESYRELFHAVSAVTGVDHKRMARFAAIESSFRKDAKAPVGTASGLFQFIDTTWEETVRRHGARFNITMKTSVFDPKANTLMFAMRVLDNIDLLQPALTHRGVTDTDLYLAHFLGRSGVVRFLNADQTNIAARAMPAAARSNQAIFYSKKTALTYGEVYAALDEKLVTKVAEFQIH